MKFQARLILVVLFFFVVGMPVPFAQAQGPQETLQQYVTDLQKNPSDTTLREKIINLVSTMSSSPEVPSEAKKHISRGVAAIEGAKNPDDFKDACDEFQQVTMLAPWLGNGYRNLAIAQDKAGMFAAALQSLSLYLLTKPASADVEWAEDLRNKVEYRKEKSAKESSPEAIAAQEQKKSDDWLQKIDGRRYRWTAPNGNDGVIDVRGKILVVGGFGDGGYHEGWRYEIKGREFTVSFPAEYQRETGRVDRTFIISEDGDRITERVRFNDGDVREYIFLWQR